MTIPIFQSSDRLQDLGVEHGFGTRRSGTVPVPGLITRKQVHGTALVRVPGSETEADALWSDETGTALGVVTADCVPFAPGFYGSSRRRSGSRWLARKRCWHSGARSHRARSRVQARAIQSHCCRRSAHRPVLLRDRSARPGADRRGLRVLAIPTQRPLHAGSLRAESLAALGAPASETIGSNVWAAARLARSPSTTATGGTGEPVGCCTGCACQNPDSAVCTRLVRRSQSRLNFCGENPDPWVA